MHGKTVLNISLSLWYTGQHWWPTLSICCCSIGVTTNDGIFTTIYKLSKGSSQTMQWTFGMTHWFYTRVRKTHFIWVLWVGLVHEYRHWIELRTSLTMRRITMCFVTGFVLLLAIKLSLAGNLHITYTLYVANQDIVQFATRMSSKIAVNIFS